MKIYRPVAGFNQKTAAPSYSASEVIQTQKKHADEYAEVDFLLSYRYPRVSVAGNKSDEKPPAYITESVRYRRIMENSVVDAEREAPNHEEKDKKDFALPMLLDLIKKAEERKKRDEEKDGPFRNRYDIYDRYDPYRGPQQEKKELKHYTLLEATVYKIMPQSLPFKREYDPHPSPRELSPIDIGHNATVKRQLQRARPLEYRLAA